MNAERHKGKGDVLLVLVLLIVASMVAQLSWSFSQGPNNRNVSVDTRVNVTGSAPTIHTIIAQNPITLAANSFSFATCNVTIEDFNGFGDISNVRAEIFSVASSSYGAADNNNTHYTNGSCTAIAGQQSGTFANYTCGFGLRYYATNGTWNCTAFVNDTINLNDTRGNLTNISALLALNVTTLVDYGNMDMGALSDNRTANVTNVGNVHINVSVAGYAQSWGDNLGFVCEQGNLSIDLQHFSANISANYTDKQTLSSSRQQMVGLTVPKPLDDAAVTNTTYWQLYLNPSQTVYGLCNGTIVFQAELG